MLLNKIFADIGAYIFMSLMFANLINGMGNKNFVCIVTSFNNKNNGVYQKNLDSIFSQTYQHYRVIYVDDASTDGNYEAVQQYIAEHHVENKVTLLHTTQRVGTHKNIWDAAHTCDPHEIIVIVDGDDWLYDETVLDYLNQIYQDPGIWITYGQFMYWPSNKRGYVEEIPEYVIDHNSFRQYKWIVSHLRTFYAGLYQKIHYKDMLMKDGTFIKRAGDVAIMLPMLEMAGQHSAFINKILYVYNGYTGDEEQTTKATNKKPSISNVPDETIEKYLRSLHTYEPLAHLF